VHQLAALPGSPGDGDVSMELTNIYADKPHAPAELAAPAADDAPAAAVPEAAAQPADTAPASTQPAAVHQDSSAVVNAASPEPLMRLEDGPAAEPAAEAEPDTETQQAPAPTDTLPLPAADPYELPASPLHAAAHQQVPTQLSDPLDGQLQPDAEQQQLQASPVAPAATALSSQLAVGSPLLDLGSPQPAASGGQSGSFGNQGGKHEVCHGPHLLFAAIALICCTLHSSARHQVTSDCMGC
jgi:hypothetical protein